MWPYWVIFENSWRQIMLQTTGIFRAILKTHYQSKNSLGYFFGNFLFSHLVTLKPLCSFISDRLDRMSWAELWFKIGLNFDVCADLVGFVNIFFQLGTRWQKDHCILVSCCQYEENEIFLLAEKLPNLTLLFLVPL